MEKTELNKMLKEVIHQAQEADIPVSSDICKEVSVNRRPKKRFGCCRKREDGFQIEISEFVLACPKDKVRNIMAHEVLHTCDGGYDHGKIWKQYAQKMNETYGYNIKRTSSFEELGLETGEQDDKIRYIIKCRKCGKEYPRQRFTCVMKKINAYRCNCGGKLTVIQVR